MHQKISLLLCSLLSACQLTDFNSNVPDGGTCLAPEGTTSGPLTVFIVLKAYNLFDTGVVNLTFSAM